MKNTNIKYKLNFKTMKKGLLTLLAASLVFVGCQNYDDQFDDLNAQISALKSQVDGLSSLSGQVSSLSGTISGLQAGVSAAQAAATAAGASADAATAAANNIDFSSLETGLNTLQAEVDQIQASLATAVTAADIATLQAELDGIEADVDELLVGSGVYTGTLQITNTALLAAADALGNGINVISGGVNISVTSDMNMTTLQSVVDKIYNVTGNVTFSNALSTVPHTAVTFNKLTSAADIQVEQAGPYSFDALVSASDIWLGNDNADYVTEVDLGALTTVDGIDTGESDAITSADTVDFDEATNIDLGAITFYVPGDLSITSKTDGTVDVGSLTDTNAAGTLNPFKLSVTGAKSLSLSSLKGDGGASDNGEIEVSKVETLTVTDFSGLIDINGNVEVVTIEDGYNVAIDGATAMTSLTLEGVAQYGKAYDALSAANKALKLYDSALLDVTVPAGADDLSSVTLTGKLGAVDLSAGLANLATVTMNAQATSLDISSTPDLNSVNLTGSTINSVTADSTGADTMTLDYTHRDTNAATAVTTGTLSVASNLDLTSLTVSADDIGNLDITGNVKLATIAFANLNSIGTVTAPDVDIYDNNLTAVKSTDTYQSATHTSRSSGDTGTYDNGTSGMGGLQTYLDAVVTNGTTATVQVFFDKVTTEVIGGESSDTTSTPGDFATTYSTYSAANMKTSASAAGEHWAVLYLFPSSEETFYQTDVVSNEVRTYNYDVNRANILLTDTALGAAEGFAIQYAASASLSFQDGSTYTSAANGSTVQTVTDLVNYMNADTTLAGLGIDVTASRDGFEKWLYTVEYITASGTIQAATASSTTGYINATFGTSENGTTQVLSSYFTAAPTEAQIANALMADIEALNLWNATTGVAHNSNPAARSNKFWVTRNVSKSGYSEQDTSPLAIDPPSLTFVLDAAQTSTTLTLTPSTFDGLFDSVSNAGSVSNLNGSTSSAGATPVFSIFASKAQYEGLAIRLKNTGTTAFSSSVTLTHMGTSQVAINSAGGKTGVADLLVAGTNMVTAASVTSSSGSTSSKPTYWVASFANINNGTPTTQGDAAVTTDRTGWLG
jgi:outer membrane murein-binding lipoprotein Lpp